MISLLRMLILNFVHWHYARFRNSYKTTEEVFTKIYENNIWGSSNGKFFSGGGSANAAIVSPYIKMISEQASSEGFRGLTFVDLGCGDFHVGRQLLPLCSQYIGIDIVKQLICRNQENYGNETTHFMHRDIVTDELPVGDVCFVRQVFQHLSNQQIGAILQKLINFKWVFITEHYPADNDAIKPNIDKVHGANIRLIVNSGVFLSEPPFKLPKQTLSNVLEVTDTAGVIRTFIYKPGV